MKNKTEFTINERFELLDNLSQMVVLDITPSLVITGSGGLGKTHSVNQTIKCAELVEGSDFVTFKGYSTARGLYNTLYDNNGKLIVFDDCDSVLEDKISVNILKTALDSYETRKITWMAKMSKSDEYPNQFEFTGRIIFISNKNKSSIDKALITRSLTVDLSMTPSEKIQRMSFILPNILPHIKEDIKLDALRFLNTKKDNADLSLRSLIMVSKMRLAFPDKWENIAEYMINS